MKRIIIFISVLSVVGIISGCAAPAVKKNSQATTDKALMTSPAYKKVVIPPNIVIEKPTVNAGDVNYLSGAWKGFRKNGQEIAIVVNRIATLDDVEAYCGFAGQGGIRAIGYVKDFYSITVEWTDGKGNRSFVTLTYVSHDVAIAKLRRGHFIEDGVAMSRIFLINESPHK
jgi:hypothetical protein